MPKTITGDTTLNVPKSFYGNAAERFGAPELALA